MPTDQLTLSDPRGNSIDATLLHVYDREEVQGSIDKAAPTFKAMAAELFAARPQASRVALVRAGAYPMFLAEINRCWWDTLLQPVSVRRRIG